MDNFEAGEIAILLGTEAEVARGKPLSAKQDVELVERVNRYPHIGEWWVIIPGDHNPSRRDGAWIVPTAFLRKKKSPPESKDIQETREKGAPSLDEMMRKLREGEVENV